MTLPINHLKATLDRCCGRWEFSKCMDDQDAFEVRLLNTSAIYQCYFNRASQTWISEVWEQGTWKHDPFLANRLNGLTRDDSGTMRTDAGGPLTYDHDCVPDSEVDTHWVVIPDETAPQYTVESIEPLKAGDWVVTPEGIGFITRVDGTTTDPLPFRVKFNKGHILCYASGELRRARPDEIPLGKQVVERLKRFVEAEKLPQPLPEVPAPSEPTAEQLTDEQGRAGDRCR